MLIVWFLGLTFLAASLGGLTAAFLATQADRRAQTGSSSRHKEQEVLDSDPKIRFRRMLRTIGAPPVVEGEPVVEPGGDLDLLVVHLLKRAIDKSLVYDAEPSDAGLRDIRRLLATADERLAAVEKAGAVGLEARPTGEPSRPAGDLALPIQALDLSERPLNALLREGILTLGELLQRTRDDLLNLTKFGETSLAEVIAKLDDLGLSLADQAANPSLAGFQMPWEDEENR